MKQKKNKKIFLIVSFIVALIFAFSTVSFANSELPDVDAVPVSGYIFLNNRFTETHHQDFLNDLCFSNNNSHVFVIYRIVSYDKIIEFLDNPVFYNSSQTACEYLCLNDTSNAYSTVISSSNYYSNFLEITGIINGIGDDLRERNSQELLINDLEDENDTLIDLNSNLEKDNNRLRDENDTLIDLNSNLKKDNDRLINETEFLFSEKAELENKNLQLINEIEGWSDAHKRLSEYAMGLEKEKETISEQLKSIGGENYSKGYNAGMKEADAFERGMITVFSSPMYVFGEAFNFEIFGINVLSIIQFLITISIISIVVSKLRG